MSVERAPSVVFFFFNDTATTEIYTLSLHDALPIWSRGCLEAYVGADAILARYEQAAPDHPLAATGTEQRLDRKSTRLNSSHANISYAVFCLKKKNLSTSSL